MVTELEVRIAMKPEAEGGRSRSIGCGYRPHLVVEGTTEFLGVQVIQADEPVVPGATALIRVALVYGGVDYSALQPGARFVIHEGPHVVGEGEVIAAIAGPGDGRG